MHLDWWSKKHYAFVVMIDPEAQSKRLETPQLEAFFQAYEQKVGGWLAAQRQERKASDAFFKKSMMIWSGPALLVTVTLYFILGAGNAFFWVGAGLCWLMLIGYAAEPELRLQQELEDKTETLLLDMLDLDRLSDDTGVNHKLLEDWILVDSSNYVKNGKGYSGKTDRVSFMIQQKKLVRGSGKNAVCVFNGVMVSATFAQPFAGLTLILRDGGKWGNALKSRALKPELSRINMNYSLFEDKFEVYSSDEIAARAVLSPDVMMALVELHDQSPSCEWMAAAMIGNILLIAIDTGSRKSFDFGCWIDESHERQIPAEVIRFASEVGVVHDILRKLDMLKRKKA